MLCFFHICTWKWSIQFSKCFDLLSYVGLLVCSLGSCLCMGDLRVGGWVGVILGNNTWKVERAAGMGRETSWIAVQLQQKSLNTPRGSLKQGCPSGRSQLRKWVSATALHHSIVFLGTVVPGEGHSLMRVSSLQPGRSWGEPQSWIGGNNGIWALYSRFP